MTDPVNVGASSMIAALKDKVAAEAAEASVALADAAAAHEAAITRHREAQAANAELETYLRPVRQRLQARGEPLAPLLQRERDECEKRAKSAMTAKAAALTALKKCQRRVEELQAAADQLESILA